MARNGKTKESKAKNGKSEESVAVTASSREPADRPDNRRKVWTDCSLISRREAHVSAPGGKSFLLVAEARLLEGSTAIQIAVGRASPDEVLAYHKGAIDDPPSPKYMRLFLEDVPTAQKLQSEVFDEALVVYKEIEERRIQDRAKREREDLRRRIAVTEGWKRQLLAIEEQMKKENEQS